VLISGEPFQPSITFVKKAGAYPSDLSGAPLLGRFQALPTNIRLGWKSLPGTNTLADYKHLSITPVKSFMTLGLVLLCVSMLNVILLRVVEPLVGENFWFRVMSKFHDIRCFFCVQYFIFISFAHVKRNRE
jgi:hypothetical protein